MSNKPIDEVLAASETRMRLLMRDDLAALSELLDDDLLYVHSTGLIQNKPELLGFFANILKVVRIEREVRFVKGFERTVCVGSVQTLHGQLRSQTGSSVQAHSYFSEVWQYTDHAWRLLHAQSTAIPAGAENATGHGGPTPN